VALFSDREILAALSTGRVSVDLADSYSQIQPASIDLTLGDTFYRQILGGPVLDPEKASESSFEKCQAEAGYIVVPPGRFVLAHTVEVVAVADDVTGFVCGKSSVARTGLTIENAGLVDAGFQGQLTLEIANLGVVPVRLRVGSPICQIYFIEMTSEAARAYGGPGSRYQGQMGPTITRQRRTSTLPGPEAD
jgi:dCTP deaminase